MGEHTGIAWTDATWNPWRGCRKVSAGCTHCYMYREQERYGRDPKIVTRASPSTFNAPLKWAASRAGTAAMRVFTCSWSDFFIEEADPWRHDAWDIIRRTPNLTYQILTKRPERVADHLPADWGDGWPNVWLGTSIESSNFAGRLDKLFKVPARIHFVSAEPLLGTMRAKRGYWPWNLSISRRSSGSWVKSKLDWVICGGESGPGARPMDLDWAREIRDFCHSNGIPFFLKQLGGWPDPRSHEKAVLDGRTWTEMP